MSCGGCQNTCLSMRKWASTQPTTTFFSSPPMAKSKPPTAQELYRKKDNARNRKKYAYDLVHFTLIPPSVQRFSLTPLASRRSPQLTKVHHLSEEDKPLGQQYADRRYVFKSDVQVMGGTGAQTEGSSQPKVCLPHVSSLTREI